MALPDAVCIGQDDLDVVQGSVIGPSSYDILASDLHPLSPQNIILKYADDTYLLVPSWASSNRHTVPSELNHIYAWAINNNLKLNVNKSRELIIHGRARFDSPPPSRVSLVSRSFPSSALS